MLELVAKPCGRCWASPPLLSNQDVVKQYDFDIRPDCAYWLSLQGFNPEYASSINQWAYVIRRHITCKSCILPGPCSCRATRPVAGAGWLRKLSMPLLSYLKIELLIRIHEKALTSLSSSKRTITIRARRKIRLLQQLRWLCTIDSTYVNRVRRSLRSRLTRMPLTSAISKSTELRFGQPRTQSGALRLKPLQVLPNGQVVK